MQLQWDATKLWAWEEFGSAALGDLRNTRRAVAMVDTAMRVQGGTICSVFRVEKQREAAYDFLENKRVSAAVLGHAAAEASAVRSQGLPWVWIAVDGTSLTLTDKIGKKGFGSVGSGNKTNQGLKVISSVVLDPWGVVLGLGEFTWWARTGPTNKLPGGKRRVDNGSRKLEEKETYHWLETIRTTRQSLRSHAPNTVRWWVIDREADSWSLLHEACRDGDLFTIRSNVDRKLQVVDESSKKVYLRETLRRQPVLDEYELRVAESANRRARTARLQVRACTVTLDMWRNLPKKPCPLQVNAVWVTEVDTTPEGEKPLDWML